jgi:hypothetical protein
MEFYEHGGELSDSITLLHFAENVAIRRVYELMCMCVLSGFLCNLPVFYAMVSFSKIIKFLVGFHMKLGL